MTFPKKGNRKITFNHQTYIWRLRGSRDYLFSLANFVIENPKYQGQLLIVNSDYRHLLDSKRHDLPITPGTVRKAIEFALHHGWTPMQKAKPISLTYNGEEFIVLTSSKSMPEIEIRPPQNQKELEEMYQQRWLVLRQPLGMVKGTEQDKYEDTSSHLIAVYNNQIIASARLRQLSPELGSISYVAVLPEFQNQGIGTTLIHQLIELAKAKNLATVRANVRINALVFYQRIGFITEGEPTNYLGIPHTFMHYKLTYPENKPAD